MKIYLDKNETTIEENDTVFVPCPNFDDIHNHEFEGTVKGFNDNYVTIEDGDGDCFDIEPERLEVKLQTYRITYRREVYITAKSESKAEDIFCEMDEDDLHKQSSYVEKMTIDEDN